MHSASIHDTTSYWFVFQSNRFITTKTHTLLNDELIQKIKDLFIRQHYIGHFNGHSCYCAEIPKEVVLPSDYDSFTLKQAVNTIGPEWFTVAAKAFSIVNWDKNHQYCGECGKATTFIQGCGYERVCGCCGLAVYPRISPSVIVLIYKGTDILMARSPHFLPGVYGLIAGFVEIGESLEETLKREVKEEVNIEVKNIRYFGSQPWPFPDSLMVGFTAEYASGELIIDDKELEAAGWYPYHQLPGLPSSSLSIARKLIDHFIAEQNR